MDESKIPKLLQEIPDAPKQLYKIGEIPNQKENIFLTIIGSRKYTSYGKTVCEKLITGLKGYPFVIVSGLALGIDSIAHYSALKNNLKTIAIPGSGLDSSVIYPASNKNLAKKIIESNGCLLSEFKPKTKAAQWTFPQRNRIMAGISHATLVIEAENKSGTRITARLATEYNREVFAIPGSIFNKASEGCNELIKEGATPITSADDILNYFHLLDEKQLKQQQLIALEPTEQLIMDILNEPNSRNTIAEKLNLPIIKLNIILSSMEIKGLIKENLGKIMKK